MSSTTDSVNTRNGGSSHHTIDPPREKYSSNIPQMDDSQEKRNSPFKLYAIIATVLCVLFLIATIVLGVKLHNTNVAKQASHPANNFPIPNQDNNQGALNWPPPSGSFHAQFKRAAIVSDHGLCSEIGRNVFLEGGNAIEGAISSLLCIGVVNPQSSGIGGGHHMTVYNATTRKCMTLDAREVAPLSATPTMFVKSPQDSVIGYRAIGTPGEIHGLWTAFRRFGSGKVTWKRLFQPSIRLARDGFPVTSHLALVLQNKKEIIKGNEEMNKTFVNPRTKRVYEEGDIMKREKLAEFLEELAAAADPVQLFYKEGIAQTIATEMKDNGGQITMEDLSAYETIVHEQPLESEVLPRGLIMCGPPPPSSFAVTQAIVGIMNQFYENKSVDLNDPLTYHRLIEAEKFAFAHRTKLGDSRFVKNALNIARNMTKPGFAKWISSLIKDQAQPLQYYTNELTEQVSDHGTSHVSARDRDGNAVSVTSTVNTHLGALRVSPTLGIIWNNEMDDFSTPNMSNFFGIAPSPENFIFPKKRPMSSMSPTIIYNKNNGKVKMILGASGGSKIITAVAQTIVWNLLFNQTIKEAVDAPRFHNQFLPHTTQYERSMPLRIIKNLVEQRHQNMTPVEKLTNVVQALAVTSDGFIHGNSDFRRKTATYPAGY